MIRLFIIEDHPIIICGLRSIFVPGRDDVEITGHAENVKEVERIAKPESFDIFILDLWIKEDDPEENVSFLRTHFPEKPIIIYTTEESGNWQRKMFAAGVPGYIFKSSDPSEIRKTLETISHGGIAYPGVTSPEDLTRLDADFITGRMSISNIQRDMVRMISLGLKQKEIANQKKISISTVEKTLYNLRLKFSAQSNADLIRILTEKGLF